MTNPTYPIGLDLGATTIKLRTPDMRVVLGSAVSVYDGRTMYRGDATTDQRPAPTLVRLGNGDTYWCGASSHMRGAPVDSVDIERLRGDEPTRALVYAAFSRAKIPAEARIMLVVGVPTELLMGERRMENVNAIKQWLMGTHTYHADGTEHTIHVDVVKVASQAVAAAVEFFLDDNGTLIPERGKFWVGDTAVVSLGGSTTELAVVNAGQIVERLTAGRNSGSFVMYGLVDPNRDYTILEMDEMVRTGARTLNGEIDRWGEMVLGFVSTKWTREVNRFGRVIVCGGGVHLLKDQMTRKFRTKLHIPAEPVQAIADGLYRMAVQFSNG
jgi:hypothetical protein